MAEIKKQADPSSLNFKSDDSIFKRFGVSSRIFSIPLNIMVIFGSFVILVMMVVIAADVVGRYFFRRPIEGTNEIVGLLFICLAACAIANAQRQKRHIRIDLFIERFTPRLRAALDIFAHLLALVIVSLITWRLFSFAGSLLLNLQGGSTVTESLRIPFFPFWVILGTGFGIFGLILIMDLSTYIYNLIKK